MAEGEQKPFIESIPEGYRDKPWAKENAASPDAFFKFVDNQNALVGKKGVIVPGEGATPEELAQFHTSIGRPEKAEGYEFKNPESLKDKPRDVEFDGKVKGLFHTAGIPKTMAEKVVTGYENLLFEKNKATLEKEQEEDKKFGDFNTKLFGENKAAVVANAQKILRETLPKEALPLFDKLPTETLSLVIAATNGIYAKYGKEDGFRGGTGSRTGGNESLEQLSADQRKLMENPGFSDFRHAEHESLRLKNNEIMAKMRALDKK